jgi:hypothetical protein
MLLKSSYKQMVVSAKGCSTALARKTTIFAIFFQVIIKKFRTRGDHSIVSCVILHCKLFDFNPFPIGTLLERKLENLFWIYYRLNKLLAIHIEYGKSKNNESKRFYRFMTVVSILTRFLQCWDRIKKCFDLQMTDHTADESELLFLIRFHGQF